MKFLVSNIALLMFNWECKIAFKLTGAGSAYKVEYPVARKFTDTELFNELEKSAWIWRKYILSLSLDMLCGAILLEQITEIK